MNRQPYGSPPRWWEPKLSPRWVRLTRGYRRRDLFKKQQLTGIDTVGIEHLQRALQAGHGILIAPNHSAHYDSAALYLAADTIDLPLYMMAAWQVFAMSKTWECWAMQRLGAFSIDRESSDKQAFKQAVHILQEEQHPLVIFPEGDIYHVSDRVTPFREGAAAIALAAAKRAERPVSVVPCAIKFLYVDDPTPGLHELLGRIEERLYLRPLVDVPLAARVHRVAEAMLALKELDYLGRTSSGRIRDRIVVLIGEVLKQLEERHELKIGTGTPPERVKNIRQKLIAQLEDEKLAASDPARFRQLQQDMEDVFFVIQCFSYPGDYLAERITIERLAETADKFEEDVLGADLPGVRGRRRVHIQFGEPITLENRPRERDRVLDLTRLMQARVQEMLNGINGTPAGEIAAQAEITGMIPTV